jgi:hypothetical protein
MSTRVLTRRAALSALGAMSFAPMAAFAQAPLRFRAVRVDVAPLRSSVGDPTAAWVEESLTPALGGVLAPYMAPGDRGAATLVARIGLLYLGPTTGGMGFFGSGQDTISGDLLVEGPRGGVVSQVPLRAITSYYPSGANQTLWVQWNRQRVDALSQAFAGWVPRQLGL